MYIQKRARIILYIRRHERLRPARSQMETINWSLWFVLRVAACVRCVTYHQRTRHYNRSNNNAANTHGAKCVGAKQTVTITWINVWSTHWCMQIIIVQIQMKEQSPPMPIQSTGRREKWKVISTLLWVRWLHLSLSPSVCGLEDYNTMNGRQHHESKINQMTWESVLRNLPRPTAIKIDHRDSGSINQCKWW